MSTTGVILNVYSFWITNTNIILGVIITQVLVKSTQQEIKNEI
jgi:membrane protein CcdC involved in cytochrome C biogenesis